MMYGWDLFALKSFGALQIFAEIDLLVSSVLRIIVDDSLIKLSLSFVILNLVLYGSFFHHEIRGEVRIVVRHSGCLTEAFDCLGILLEVDIAVTFKTHSGSTDHLFLSVIVVEVVNSFLIFALTVKENCSVEVGAIAGIISVLVSHLLILLESQRVVAHHHSDIGLTYCVIGGGDTGLAYAVDITEHDDNEGSYYQGCPYNNFLVIFHFLLNASKTVIEGLDRGFCFGSVLFCHCYVILIVIKNGMCVIIYEMQN